MSAKKMSFEEALERLEKIVDQLESGEITLDKSIEAFEEGQKLVTFCLKQLEQAESKVKKLTRGDDGQLQINEF